MNDYNIEQLNELKQTLQTAFSQSSLLYSEVYDQISNQLENQVSLNQAIRQIMIAIDRVKSKQ